MGGTSTDCSTMIGGQESFTTDFEIEWGLPIQMPMIDIRTIGAGGGSIAWIDKGGMLRVGPQSAGAKPGPGLLRPRRQRGDRHRRQSRARPHQPGLLPWRHDEARRRRGAARDRRASPSALGHSVEETALAIVRIANNNMVGALRTVLIERGLDPRDFTLLRLRRRRAAARRRPDARDGHPARHRAQPSRPVLGLRLHHDRRAGRPPPHRCS